jgi:hypothetical protein
MAATATKLQTPATEPATPLEQALQASRQLTESLADLNRAAARLHAAANAEADVVAEIAALGAAETEAMTKWGRGGCIGDAPRSDQNQRIKLGQKLNAVQASAAAAVGAGQDINHDILRQTEQLALLNDQIEQAIFDTVEREHGDVIAEYTKVCEQGGQLATRISGLALLFRETGNNQRAAAIFTRKLPTVSTNPREVQLAADAWSRRIAELRKGSAS